MQLRNGSVVREKLHREGLRFTADTSSDLRQEIVNRLKTSVHRLEASYKKPALDPLAHWYKGSFAQMKAFLAQEITEIVIRQSPKGFPGPVSYEVWDEELKKLEKLWEPSNS